MTSILHSSDVITALERRRRGAGISLGYWKAQYISGAGYIFILQHPLFHYLTKRLNTSGLKPRSSDPNFGLGLTIGLNEFFLDVAKLKLTKAHLPPSSICGVWRAEEIPRGHGRRLAAPYI